MNDAIFSFLFSFISGIYCQTLINARSDESLRFAQSNHRSLPVNEQHFSRISNELEGNDFIDQILPNILVPRVSGTPENDVVREYISNQMRNLNWDVEENEFYDQTPIDAKGSLRKFTNVIARLNPNANRYLTLACHYDSKLMKNFVGATDSAVPCAIMINVAYKLNRYLQTRRSTDLSLMFIFFDGEEAFKDWNAEDSIYGARHLAAKWHGQDKLKHMDVMVLLDLLGAPNPKFYNHFPETAKWHGLLVDIESRLNDVEGLARHVQNGASSKKRFDGYFQPYSLYNAGIEDDHIPFYRRGVLIVHVIPTPFPEVWHRPEDDAEAIDFSTFNNLSKIFAIFCLEYLGIGVGPKH